MELFNSIFFRKIAIKNLLMKGILYLSVLIFPKFAASQTILPTNSSPTGFSVAPVGWTILAGTTDISNKDFWAGITPWAESTVNLPNGHHVWVSGYLFESVGSTISDLTIDASYTMSFYMCELRYSAVGAPYDGTLQVTVGTEEFLFPFTGGYDRMGGYKIRGEGRIYMPVRTTRYLAVRFSVRHIIIRDDIAIGMEPFTDQNG